MNRRSWAQTLRSKSLAGVVYDHTVTFDDVWRFVNCALSVTAIFLLAETAYDVWNKITLRPKLHLVSLLFIFVSLAGSSIISIQRAAPASLFTAFTTVGLSIIVFSYLIKDRRVWKRKPKTWSDGDGETAA